MSIKRTIAGKKSAAVTKAKRNWLEIVVKGLNDLEKWNGNLTELENGFCSWEFFGRGETDHVFDCQ